MKRANRVRYKKRTTRPAARKQQLLRKEAQKRAKYVIRTVRQSHAPMRHYERSA